MLHLIVAGGDDPSDDHTWSGTPKSLIAELRRRGHLVTVAGPLSPLETCQVRAKRWFYRYVRDKRYIPSRDPIAVGARQDALNAMVRAAGPAGAVIALDAGDTAILRCDAPLIFVHDATWHDLLDFYPRYDRRRLAPETIAGGHELTRMALANCDRVIYSSNWAAASARANYGLNSSKIRVHPFGANLTTVPTAEAVRCSIVRRGQGVCRLLFVGVDWWRKGGDIAIAVTRALVASGIPAELYVVGSDPPAGADPVVRAHGFLDRKNKIQAAELTSLFAEADFLLLPSRADCSPIVLSEAAANGLPVVSTAVGGIPEIMGEGSWGQLFAPNAPAADYAAWIARTFADRALYEFMARRARQEYENRLSWEAFGQMLVAEIEALRPRSETRASAAVA